MYTDMSNKMEIKKCHTVGIYYKIQTTNSRNWGKIYTP